MANKNYNKMPSDPKTEKTKVTPAPAGKPKAKIIDGYVVPDCERLNIRSKPSLDSESLTTVVKGDQVKINLELSTDDFYSVSVSKDGEKFIGYALKERIAQSVNRKEK